jgi:single-strand DNA-binding protein
MSYELTGNIEMIYPKEQITGNFSKRRFVVERVKEVDGTQYTDYVKFIVFNKMCVALDEFELGDTVKVFFDFTGNKYHFEGEMRYGSDVKCWKIEKV